MLLLSFWDVKSLIPCSLSLHRENKNHEYGLNKKQQKNNLKRKERIRDILKSVTTNLMKVN
jgi:hypothetical protein